MDKKPKTSGLASPTGRRDDDASATRRGAPPLSTQKSKEGPNDFALPALAPPKGGGAIQGIDAKFSTNPSTGTCSLSIPISASPGRAGFTLGLGIAYDSGAGNGPCGLGWQLSVPAIMRRTERGLPRYRDDEDAFVLSGSEELVVERSQDGRLVERERDGFVVRRYRPRVEGAFTRIERWTDVRSGDVHWKTRSADDTTSIFGRSPETRVADPSDPRRVHSWLLEETHDARGNVARYSYKAEDAAGVDPGAASEAHRFVEGAFLATAQRHVKRVVYGNVRPFDASAFLFEVVFDYGEHDADTPAPEEVRPWPVRLDPFSTYRSGFEVRTYRLLRRVLVFHRIAELGDEPVLVRSTDFTYEERAHLTRLVQVEHAGWARDERTSAYERATLPVLGVAYTDRSIHDEVRFVDRASLEGLPGGTDRRNAQWVDLDGEGIAGVLVSSRGALHYKANRGCGKLDPPRLLTSLPQSAAAEDGTGAQQLTDLAGDGRIALVRYSPPPAGYFARTHDGGWEPFVPFRSLPNVDWTSEDVRFLDLDGDGHPDLLLTDDESFIWYRSRATEGFDPPEMVARSKDEDTGPTVVFRDRTEAIFLADMTGDGLSDIVRVRSGEVAYWPNLGYGRFGRKITMEGSPRLAAPGGFDPNRVRIADVDGSGTSDLLYLEADAVHVHFNESGNRFARGAKLALSVPFPGTSVSVVDLLGNGTACIVWSSSMPAQGARPVAYVDLMGGTKPHLLSSFTNGFGGETRVEYASSTSFYLRDKADEKPWITKLPFPVHVVAKVTKLDHVANTSLVTRMRYHHGFYDGVEREYRGFAFVEQWDAETFDAESELVRPPTRTRTWFHTGAWLERERLEAQLACEWYDGDPAARPLAAPPLPKGLSFAEQREAMRAARGRVLRQEIYADDRRSESIHPYSVSEQTWEVRCIQRAHRDENGVFFVHARDKVEHAYERNPADPRSRQESVLEVDDYGNVVRTMAIAHPRRSAVEPEQQRRWATLSERNVANVDTDEVHRVGVQFESRTEEITGLEGPFSSDDLRALLDHGRSERRLLARERTYYYADDRSGPLPLGQVGRRALPYERLTQAFTRELLAAAYEGRVDDALLSSEGGYRHVDGVWWSPSNRLVYDPDAFYQPIRSLDPFGRWSHVRYDRYSLVVVEAADTLGSKVTAGTRDASGESRYDGIDYRVLAPWLVTDANLNRTAGAFDALGMPVRLATMGKAGKEEGDTLDDPTTRIEYDLHRFVTSGGTQPIVVRSIARELHGRDNPQWLEAFNYVDGSGRDVMRKVEAEPAPGSAKKRWVGTGRTVFDNKGAVVKRYEPFFSDVPEFESDRALVESGIAQTRRYDPLGRLVRTELPNGTLQRVVIGPWSQEAWDENDSVLESEWFAARGSPDPSGPEPEDPRVRAAWLAAHHARTPRRTHLDALGRTFLTDEDGCLTRVELDAAGNLLAMFDGRGVRIVDGQVFDMTGRRIVATTADGGRSRTLPDLAALPVRSWDARGHAIRIGYDELRRPTDIWVRSDSHAERLVSRVEYGESSPEAIERNLRGRAHRTYDGAGLVTNARYDFAGNLVELERRLARDGIRAPDWSRAEPEALLEKETFTRRSAFDALGRVTSSVTPDGSETRPTYNEGNLLRRLEVRLRGSEAWTTFLADVGYDARGQRTRAVDGTGAVTTYEYERDTFRLHRLSTVRDRVLLQDHRYEYDPVGNVVADLDGVSFGNAKVGGDAIYVYDARYRIVRAEGREHPGQQPSFEDLGTLDLAHPHDFERLVRYREHYAYDVVGNVARVEHSAAGRRWVRRFEYEPGSSRLARTTGPDDAAPGERYTYDAHGNTTSMPHLPEMRWDHADRLEEADRVGGGRVFFAYDASGQRVRKVYEHGGLVEERIYLSGFEIHRKRHAGRDEVVFERQTLHVMDDRRRVAMVETKDDASRVRFHVENHLGSTTMEIDAEGRVISYEEYLPFGSPALRAVGPLLGGEPNRYRYTGKERDEETGLLYCGARYYASWLLRWVSVDPDLEKQEEGQRLDQPYVYVENRPIVAVDPEGRVIWFLVAAIVVVATATAVSPANAPTSEEDARRAQPRIGDGEFVAHTAVVGVTMAFGAAGGSYVLEATGSKVLAGMWGGGLGGATLAPSDMFVHDSFSGQSHSGWDYADATAKGWLFGVGTGGLFGLGSRVIGGAYQPRVPFAPEGAPPPLELNGGVGGDIPYVNVKPAPNMVSQELPMSCGPACVRQVLADEGIIVTEAQVRAAVPRFNAELGTDAESLAQGAQTFRSGPVRGGTFEAEGAPVDPARLPTPWIARLKPGTGPHYVIVDEVGESAVAIRDPWGAAAPGPGQGMSGTITREAFDELWRNAIQKAVLFFK